MNVLVFNAGSASLKFEVISTPDSTNSDMGHKLVSAIVEGIGENAVLSQQEGKKVIHKEQITAHDYEEATHRALEWLDSQLKEINIVGHRVVHGGNQFTAPVLINDRVIAEIEALEELAPLHNSPAVSVIRAARAKLGADMAMVAVFDTVFHRTIPEYAKLYAIPPELSERHQIQRYGFHGISHQYLLTRYAKSVNTRQEDVNIITLHLESGCSATAIQAGKSIDTSMGFTPLEGLMMGKRSGDIEESDCRVSGSQGGC